MHFLPAPMPTVFCFNNGLVEQMSEVVGMSIGPQDNIAAAAAITAIRPPLGTNFSRRKLTHPRPPFPACAKTLIRSTNTARDTATVNLRCHPTALALRPPGRRLFCHPERSEGPLNDSNHHTIKKTCD